jgi:PAS domain S-box-containing protein
LNRGAALITSQQEREQLAELNLMAGQRAKGSAAFASALTYLASGAALLEEDCWECRHDLAFALELNRAECEYSTCQSGPAEERLSALATHADALVERAAIACLRMDLYQTQAQAHRAIGVGLDFLRDMGVEWSPHPSEEELRREYERIRSQLGPRPIEDLIDLPVLSDPSSLATLDVLAKLAVPAHATDNNLHGLVNCRAVSLSIERGNCEASCYAYVWLGAIVGAQFGDYQAGYRFARIGYELGEQRGWKSLQPATYLVFGSVILPWARHVKDGRDLMRRAIESANSIGDLHFAVGTGPLLNTNMLAAGDHLAEVERVARRHLELALKAGFGLSIEASAAQLALVRTLRGMTPTFGCLDDEQFEEAAAEHRFAGNPNLQHAECWYWIRKLQARLLAGDYAAAITCSSRAERLLWTAKVVFEAAEYHLYSALSRAACCDTVSRDGLQHHLEAMVLHQRQLDIWARNCPENFENRAWLVGAEIARIEGRELDAERMYEDAIRSARENEFVHNEALANELAARFYAARGFHTIAQAYLRNARYGYLRWGADGKVRQLDQLYPHLKTQDAAAVPTGTIDAPLEQLDLATVIKVSQSISGEMVLEKLLDTLMRTAIEHAGAERAVLMLTRGAEQRIVAEATTNIDKVVVQLLDQPVTASVLPETILRYVLHTHESVFLDDASVQNPFSTDPYVGQRLARSVLCLPLMNQAKLIGVLYLENNLAPHVFVPARAAVLKLLASQAAISLENSRLYRDLAEREAKVRRLGDANIIGICIWDLDGRILQANDAFLGMVGYHRGDLAAGRVRRTDLTPPDWHERDERAVAEVKATASVQPYEKEFFRKDGSRVPVLVGAALFQEGGTEGVAFVLDLSEQKRAEAEIRALKDQLYKENLVLRDEVDRTSMFEEIVGSSKTLNTVLSRIARVAPTDSTVFISGETGTGKELIARAVHKRSQRAGRAFVSVNCAALAPTLISSELFGHEKGAFTGATQRRLGRFELADGGTIFLDEVGELLPDTQVALLRVLQEREFERVGGTQPIHVDVRVITATNRDLKAAIANGSFRQDLFYRLNVFPIEVPPLRERKDDLLMLVEYFVQRYASRAGKTIHSIDKKTLDRLQDYDWPGNIRELQNVIERSVILSSRGVFAVDELWLSTQSSQPTPQMTQSAPFQGDPRGEREIIEAALAESRGRIAGPSGAAARLNIPPSTLEYKIRSLKIRKSQFKFGGDPRRNR